MHNCTHGLAANEQECWLWTQDSSESLYRASLPQWVLPVQGDPRPWCQEAGIKPGHSKCSEVWKPPGRGFLGARHRGAQPAQLGPARAMTKPPSWEDEGSEGPLKCCWPGSRTCNCLIVSPAFADDQTPLLTLGWESPGPCYCRHRHCESRVRSDSGVHASAPGAACLSLE